MDQIVLLGTGTANVDGERFGSATAVLVDGFAYLVDCGAGVMQRAAAGYRQGVDALAPAKLSTLFLTHLHADHTTGYADLILGSWIAGRDEPLQVYGPRGTRAMTENLLRAYEVDIRERINGVESLPSDGYQVEARDIDARLCFEDERVKVEAFAVNHGSLDAFGYVFKTASHRIVFSGDTTPVEAVVQHALGADVLIHNAFSAHAIKQRSKESQEIHKTLLTTAEQAGEIANRSSAQRLILTHLESWETATELAAEARRKYDGEVTVAKDGLLITLS